MSKLRQQSTATYHIAFLMVDSADHITGKTGLTVTVTVSKNAGAFGSANGAVTEISGGWYKLAGNATDTNTLGSLAIHATASGADPTDDLYEVVTHDPFAMFPTNFASFSIDGSGRVDVAKISGTTQTARDLGTSVLLSSGTGTGQVSLTSGAVTVVTNNDKTGYRLSATGVDDVWDEAISGHLTAGTTGESLSNAGAAGTPPTVVAIRTEMDSNSTKLIAINAKTTNLPSDPADASDIASSFSGVNTKLDTIDDFLDTEIAAIKTKTDTLGAALPTFTVVSDGGNTATTFKTDRTETANDYWKDAFVTLTSGVLSGQVHRCLAYNGTTKFITVTTAFTAAPAAGVTGDLVNR